MEIGDEMLESVDELRWLVERDRNFSSFQSYLFVVEIDSAARPLDLEIAASFFQIKLQMMSGHQALNGRIEKASISEIWKPLN